MIAALILHLAAKANSVASGGVLSLALPLGLTVIAFLLGYVAIRRETNRRAPGE
jgi:hypothetical protein